MQIDLRYPTQVGPDALGVVASIVRARIAFSC